MAYLICNIHYLTLWESALLGKTLKINGLMDVWGDT